jgi:transcriptional regulator with XRE-family HTH domain
MGTTNTSKSHIGNKVKRLREIKGIKQETMANRLGADWTQVKISNLESQETIEEGLLQQVAEILNMSPEMIKTFDETDVNNFFNTFNDNSVNNAPIGNLYYCTFNPLDKVVELYERLLKSENKNKGRSKDIE